MNSQFLEDMAPSTIPERPWLSIETLFNESAINKRKKVHKLFVSYLSVNTYLKNEKNMVQNEFGHDKGLFLFKNVCDWFRIKLGITTSLILGHSVKTIKLEIDKFS